MSWRKALPRVRVHFRKLNSALHGASQEGDVWIDLGRRTNPARVFLHEVLHQAYPEKSETHIMNLERTIWNKMSQRERYLLYRNLFLRKWRSNPLWSTEE